MTFDAPLVVVHAPAGFGKTTAARAALAAAPNVAWYDAQAWEADAFVAPLVERVRDVRADAGRLTLALAADGAAPDRLGATFAAELGHVDRALTIVVDDAHVLGAPFAAFARALVGAMPPAVQVVLLTRTPLDVGLPNAVAAGRGLLVDAHALRFDRARVASLAATLGVRADAARLDDILARTDGWPIAVALALRAPGSAGALLDELVAGRLDALDEDDRALLDATLAFEMIEPEVVAPGDASVASRFAALAEDATLAARVQHGFRVHPLVRDVLVRRIGANAHANRHGVAADAYLRAGRLRPAVFHLERARDPQRDLAFVRAHAAAAIASGLMDAVRAAAGRAQDEVPAPVHALLDGLFAKARGDDGRASFARAASLADAERDGDLAFEARVQWIEADLAHGDRVAPDRIDDMLARSAAFGAAARITAIVRAGWADAVDGRFADVLARLDDIGAGDPGVLGDVAPLAAYAHLALGDFEAAERAVTALVDAWSSSDDVLRYAGALGWAARFALLRGETTSAFELAREASRIARPFALRAQAAAMHATLGEAALHAGDTALARREARAAQRTADQAWYARDAARARTIASRIAARADALDGDAAGALRAAAGDDALSLADAAAFAALAHDAGAASLRARARAAISASEPADGADAVALLGAAELLDFLDALDGTDVETPLRSGPFEGLLERRAADVRLAHLGVALRRIARFGHAPDAYAAGFAVATAGGPRFETHVVARFAAPLLAGAAAPKRAEAALEPLTAREHEILTLLAGGLTNREIAERLFLSARTVETHVARITGKLGVNSRARAVARAVALGLVEPGAAEGDGAGLFVR